MAYFLSSGAVLKHLESPSVYHIKKDELYEVDEEAFTFLKRCASAEGCSCPTDEFIEYCLREDILASAHGRPIHPSVSPSPVPSLRYLELQITDRCNLRCSHCYISDSQSHELTIKQIGDVCGELEQMQGLRLLITGGEPLLHSSFSRINALLPGFSFRKALFTNGLLLTPRTLETLNVHEIQISIDGLEASHDSLRGKGTFKIALDTLHRALDSGFDVSVATMIQRNNLGDFQELESLFRGLGVREWTVDVPCDTGRLSRHPELTVTPEDCGKYLAYGYGNGLHGSASGYACGLHLMSVMADGKVAKCTFYKDSPIGMISEGLRTCWHRMKPLKLEALRCDCDHIEACRGGCRFRAGLLGDPMGKDLYRCSLYR